MITEIIPEPKDLYVPVDDLDMFKTFVLLSLDLKDGPLYFIIKGSSNYYQDDNELQSHSKYYYEEHTCPTNFIRIPLICFKGDTDQHGLFTHVRTVYMPLEYLECEDNEEDEFVASLFPEIEATIFKSQENTESNFE